MRIEDSNTKKDFESLLAFRGFAGCTASSQHNVCDPHFSTEVQETNHQEFHAEELACSTTQSVSSGPESTTTAQTKPINEAKCIGTTTSCQGESDCSTTQA